MLILHGTTREEYLLHLRVKMSIWYGGLTDTTADGNNEVMFRSSTNGGQAFGDKINL